jgi:hypothetical protein
LATNSCLVTAKRMATDIHGRWYYYPREPHSTRRPRHRAPSFPTCPSSALLSIIGTIAASCSNVNASPAPPPFLCPSFDPQHTPIATVGTHIPGKVVSHSPNQTDRFAGIARRLPDRFDRGDDGRWRRVDKYTLYGSTVCLVCPLFMLENALSRFMITDLRRIRTLK